MIFLAAESNENFPLCRFVSEGGRWELGVAPVAFGRCVRVGPVGEQLYTFDYCAGDSGIFLMDLFAVVLLILKGVPEDIREWDLQDLLPRETIRPVYNDPDCWPKLVAMAEVQLGKPYLPLLKGKPQQKEMVWNKQREKQTGPD